MDLFEILHQTLFGAIAAAGFGVLFNCPPRFVVYCFGAGAIALVTRTIGLEFGLSLPFASFSAALVLAIVGRTIHHLPSVAGTVLAVVGCIPMVPGSLAAQGLRSLFSLLKAAPSDRAVDTIAAVGNLTIVFATLVAIGTALVLPSLIFPQKQKAVA